MPIPGPTDDTLFDAEALGHLLGKEVAAERGAIVEHVVWGWLAPVLGLTERPSTGSPEHDRLFSWAIELGAIAHENPAGLSEKKLGTASARFGDERRVQILADAATSGPGAAAAGPQGDFPPAPRYPDPAHLPYVARW